MMRMRWGEGRAWWCTGPAIIRIPRSNALVLRQMQIFANALRMLPFLVGVSSPSLAQIEEMTAAAFVENPVELRVVGHIGVEECRELIQEKALDVAAAS